MIMGPFVQHFNCNELKKLLIYNSTCKPIDYDKLSLCHYHGIIEEDQIRTCTSQTMSCPRVTASHQRFITRVFFWTLFLLCSTAFAFQSYDCFKKWLSCPQGIKTSLQHQTKIEFPSITFCPRFLDIHGGNLPLNPYNWTIVKKCGIIFHEKFNGIDPECQDSKNLWESMTLKLEDFGIREGQIFYLDSRMEVLKISESEPIWRRIVSYYMGACYALTLPTEITQKGIYYMKFEIMADRTLYIFAHPKGLLNILEPWRSLAFSVDALFPHYGFDLQIDYQQSVALDFDGRKCENDRNYDFIDCVKARILERTLEEVGCTTPYGNDLENICETEEKAKKAWAIYKEENINISCLYPCTYLSNFSRKKSVIAAKNGTRDLYIGYGEYIQKNVSSCTYSGLDLFAAVGGYVGLFLGISILHISDCFSLVLRKLLQK